MRLPRRTIIKTSCGARPHIRIYTWRNYPPLLSHRARMSFQRHDRLTRVYRERASLCSIRRCRDHGEGEEVKNPRSTWGAVDENATSSPPRSRKRRGETLGVLARTHAVVSMSQLKSGWKPTRSRDSASRINRRDEHGLFFQTEFYINAPDIHIFAFTWVAASEFLQKIGADGMLNVTSNYRETDALTDGFKKERNIDTLVERRKMREEFKKITNNVLIIRIINIKKYSL